ncbi:MAG: ATP-dependent DNA helicase RecG [Acidobacteria bacterium]|nr:ATP-dependent DNA helicase RecG [Acidobacteriota bacterium]
MPPGPPRLPLSARISVLPGLGPARTALLEENGIQTLRDLLWSLPFRYVDRGSIQTLGSLEGRFLAWDPDRGPVTVVATLQEVRQSSSRIQRMPLTEAILEDGSGRLRAIWFNQPYLGRTLHPGDRILAFGPLAAGRNGLELRSPQFEVLGRGGSGEDAFPRRFLPLYRRMGNFSSRQRNRMVEEALLRAAEPEDFLPPELSAGLPDLLGALRLLHQPPDESDAGALEARATPAHRRLACEELFAFGLGVVLRRSGRLARRGVLIPTSPELGERLRSLLPFHLTAAQRRAFKDIVEDLTSGRVMHRLLQGDVGSGKTMVAFLTMAMVAETGGQAALLAPTEVLARQHADTFSRLLGPGRDRLQLLLGPMRAGEKREGLARIRSGEAAYIVGTHALFQESVNFQGLRLVVVDEQQRFGVRQREALKEKGGDPHWLVMSATPIPRSLALALFGDLDQSVLDELPPGRQPIATKLVEPEDAERAWVLMERELAEGRQAYVVSPAIDPSDEGKVSLRDIQAMEELLQSRFPGRAIEVVHGRLRTAELASRMARFVGGASPILLATTVIEVGVDVPNATVMVVDHAERFGLSQLHQLRGRVGRGGAKSHFLMLSRSETERLQVLVETQDGFRIAQRDLELRGPGEFFGTRQSGLPQFEVADLVRDRALLLNCREVAERVLAKGLSEAQTAWLRAEQARLKLAEVS